MSRPGLKAQGGREATIFDMTPRPEFTPLCDVHHTSMQRKMLEEDSDEIRSYHGCMRRDCTRVFREANGYSDIVEGQFDESRTSVRICPACSAVLYLAEVDRSLKMETWECMGTECDYSEEFPSPSAR